MNRAPSDDPTVHRELIVQDPPQEGRDVANLQRALRDRLKARGLADDVPVPSHGKFTHATWLACVEAGYFLGLLSPTYLATDKGRGLSTEGAQTIIRNPDQRTDEQLERAKVRQRRLDEGPRYYDELASKVAPTVGKGPQAALSFARTNIGTHEQPNGSNWGPKISDWIKLAGYDGPVPWCGCFVNACCIAAGVPNGKGWIGFTPAIIIHVRGRSGGWSWHGDGEPGDLVLFDTPGGASAVHVGMVESRIAHDHYRTIEGNTSSGSRGSQDNGGGVYRRERVSSTGFKIVGFARPPW